MFAMCCLRKIDCIDVSEKPNKINTKRLQMIMELYEQLDGVI